MFMHVLRFSCSVYTFVSHDCHVRSVNPTLIQFILLDIFHINYSLLLYITYTYTHTYDTLSFSRERHRNRRQIRIDKIWRGRERFKRIDLPIDSISSDVFIPTDTYHFCFVYWVRPTFAAKARYTRCTYTILRI